MPDPAPALRPQSCNYCRARILWARTPAGKAMPVDAVPVVTGNVYITLDGKTLRATVQTRAHRNDPSWAKVPRHVHHAVSCPDAPQWSPGMAKARGSAASPLGAPSGLPPVMHPAAPVSAQEGLF